MKTSRDPRHEQRKYRCEHDPDDDSPKAYRVQMEIDGEWYWFPKSQCDIQVLGGTTWIFMPKWLADDKGFEE